MTLAELRGGVMVRLGPRERIPLAAVDIEIHNAVDDIRAMAKLMGVENLDRCKYLDTASGKDIYEWPAEAEEVRDVFYLGWGPSPIPMTEVTFREQHLVDWVGLTGSIRPFSWVQLPGRRFRIMAGLIQDKTDNLMVRFFPGPKKMVKDDDEPNLPRAVHENIIPYAIMRMASYDGIGLSHPASFNYYKAQMQGRLEVYLQPESVSGAANHIVDTDDLYSGGA